MDCRCDRPTIQKRQPQRKQNPRCSRSPRNPRHRHPTHRRFPNHLVLHRSPNDEQRLSDFLQEVNTNGFLSSVRLLGETRFSSRRGFLLRQRLRQSQRLFGERCDRLLGKCDRVFEGGAIGFPKEIR